MSLLQHPKKRIPTSTLRGPFALQSNEFDVEKVRSDLEAQDLVATMEIRSTARSSLQGAVKRRNFQGAGSNEEYRAELLGREKDQQQDEWLEKRYECR